MEARRRIYVPCYLEMLARPDRASLLQRLREAALEQPVVLWDPDSYDVTRHGMTDLLEALTFSDRSFAHAFVVALAAQGREERLLLPR